MENKAKINLKYECLNLPKTPERVKILSETQQKYQRQKRTIDSMSQVKLGWGSNKKGLA